MEPPKRGVRLVDNGGARRHEASRSRVIDYRRALEPRVIPPHEVLVLKIELGLL